MKREFLAAMWHGLGGSAEVLDRVSFVGTGDLPSVFAVADFAAAAIGAAGAAMAELMGARFGDLPRVIVSSRLASMWYAWSIRPEGWTMPGPWDPVAGDYRTADGWIRLHTNAPHHREAALRVLGAPGDKEKVAQIVSGWRADELENAVIQAGGCAATMRSLDSWKQHAQSQSLPGSIETSLDRNDLAWSPTPSRPLQGLRVLDLTRVLAGPVATRFLAGFGAQVLRIDSPTWDEPGVVLEVTLGKRCARLDLRDATHRARFNQLLSQAHVLVHGYRADALANLGLGPAERRAIRPGLVDVCLNAYGWSGPWMKRRGFDSLVQMSAGIADEGMRVLGKDRPTPLPVQALDHATGYLMAAAVIRGLSTNSGFRARASLAGTAELLVSRRPAAPISSVVSATEADWNDEPELTALGPARRLRPPVQIGETVMRWERPAATLGSAAPEWVM
ncbi:MAG: CoA transferase [Proteobacteria bacterium]|nr:CoA transferase [Pseudomonadota bacterium]